MSEPSKTASEKLVVNTVCACRDVVATSLILPIALWMGDGRLSTIGTALAQSVRDHMRYIAELPPTKPDQL